MRLTPMWIIWVGVALVIHTVGVSIGPHYEWWGGYWNPTSLVALGIFILSFFTLDYEKHSQKSRKVSQ